MKDTTMDDPDALVAEAEKIKATFELDADDAQSAGWDADVTKAQVADLWLIAREKLDDLVVRHRRAEARIQSEATRAVFGADDLRALDADQATHAVSYRDAQDRADQVETEQQMLSLISRADGVGDELLARACAVKAVRSNWDEVVEFYEDRSPGFGEKVREARERQQSVALARAIRFRLAKPEVLGKMDATQLKSYRDRVGIELEQRQAAAKARRERSRSKMLLL